MINHLKYPLIFTLKQIGILIPFLILVWLLIKKIPKKLIFGSNKKVKFFNFFIPPFIAICSLILFSSSFIYFYSPYENIEKKELINSE